MDGCSSPKDDHEFFFCPEIHPCPCIRRPCSCTFSQFLQRSLIQTLQIWLSAYDSFCDQNELVCLSLVFTGETPLHPKLHIRNKTQMLARSGTSQMLLQYQNICYRRRILQPCVPYLRKHLSSGTCMQAWLLY